MSTQTESHIRPDHRRYFLLRAFAGRNNNPSSYTDVKPVAEMMLRVNFPDDFAAGNAKLENTFREAINFREIKCVQGGFIITERGLAEIPVIEDRMSRHL